MGARRKVVIALLPRVLARVAPSRRQRLALEVLRATLVVSTPQQKGRMHRAVSSDALMWPTSSKADEIHTAGLFAAVREVSSVAGEIVECGVGHGRSLVTLARAAELHAPDKRVVGFDSFSGFPPGAVHDVGARVRREGEVPSGWDDTSIALVRDVLDAPAELVAGYFSDTIPEQLPAQISLLHVDCDMYDSTRQVLHHALPRVQPGGIVVLDEYKEQDRWPGATRAIDECLELHGLVARWDPALWRYVTRFASDAGDAVGERSSGSA